LPKHKNETVNECKSEEQENQHDSFVSFGRFAFPLMFFYLILLPLVNYLSQSLNMNFEYKNPRVTKKGKRCLNVMA